MKKHILTLLALLMCAFQTVSAYEYFTIYFSDGTKSEAFYATDVDSICYSKLSLDSIAYNDWQVQEIWTCDSVYRYPLALIDRLDFKDVDENLMAEDIDRINISITPLYIQYRSIEEMSNHISTILNVEGVEDAWTDNQALFVKIRNWGIISYLYPPMLEPINELAAFQNKERAPKRSSSSSSHIHATATKACIFYQMYKDENKDFEEAGKVANSLADRLDYMGIGCDYESTNLNSSFFINDIFDYDLVFLLTHGEYDGKHHWLFTGEEILCSKSDNIINDIAAWTKFLLKYKLSPNKLSVGTLFEIRNGEPVVVHYVKVSEEFIGSSVKSFSNPNGSMIFNIACESLKGPDNTDDTMAKVFLDKSAGCYLGYTDTNGIGHAAGEYFFCNLLNGKHAQSSFYDIPSEWKEQNKIYNGKECHPVLIFISNSNSKANCITHSETLSATDVSTESGPSHVLHGKLKMLNILELISSYEYGFQWSTNPDMSQPDSDTVKDNYYDNSTLCMNWEKALDESKLHPNTTYYYRAYMNDGYSDCYGEVKSFTTGENGSGTGEVDTSDYDAYCVFDGSTVTFFYDNKKYENAVALSGRIISAGTISVFSETVTKVVFDSSYSKYKPKKTSFWFHGCNKLISIKNIDNLNTSEVIDMSMMFNGCSSLESLDLSSFNTANVKNMSYMFYDCSSLTSLVVDNFNTTNVTDMSDMFSGCSSMKSLDVSSFKTDNVTNMYSMFSDCSSLTSLDLSNFNTSNVEYMSWMFNECSSLVRINLNSFDTGKVKFMKRMFFNCASLISIDLSSFNLLMEPDMEEIFAGCTSLTTIYARYGHSFGHGQWSFAGCDNLKGGQGTKIGKNLYGYDKEGNPLYYYCSSHGDAAHIDGGKDNPGLFTAK